ncbi:beta-lactamase [Marmoricola endophyticus]|uniref:Beta-lactamase n=1 Tax=Marmoricola endophyticus TaxID=2040280 RepID=A0A917BKC6_9ACTN|nr:class A beta-lactamase [Marmoricola endophyticus]GGF49001.1 beta-lactamase [Marmoricola endophyticus]
MTTDNQQGEEPMGSMTRRTALLGSGGVATALAAGLAGTARAGAAVPTTAAELEATYDVTLGLWAERLGSGRRLTHRPDRRFPMLSTFKVLAAAAVLRTGTDLDEVVRYSDADVVENSPVTGERRRISYADAIDAGLRYSDNTAGNIMLDRIGGPAGLTRFLRDTGDRTSRLDRTEPTLNEALPGDERDTSTPRAIAASYARLLLRDTLSDRDRYLLRAVMQGSTTSVTKLRADLPTGWWAADKTGGGAYATQNDVGVLFTPAGDRIVFAVLTRTDDPDRTADPALMVDAGRLIASRLG